MKNFRDLQVWEKAHRFTLDVYRVTKDFPREELYGRTSQLRRAAASIAANIAEGCGKGSGPDFAKFLQIAFGSACECEYHILLAKDLNFLEMTEYGGLEANIVEVKRMLASLISKVRSDG
jgi:four helix bundle protein